MIRILAAALAIPFSATAAEGQPGLIHREFLYEPGSHPECHASTIALSQGGLVAAWFGGVEEGHPEVKIYVSRRGEDGWSPAVAVAEGVHPDGGRSLPCWNPVLYQPESGPLVLFYKVGPSPERWWGERRESTDGGRTWSEAVRLPDGFLGPVKNRPVAVPGGGILAASSTETPEKPSRWRIHFEHSAPPWDTWTKSEPSSPGDPAIDAIQPSVLIHPDNRLQALGRTRSGRIFEVWSEDAGKTWGPVTLTTLPNPNAGTDAVTLRDGRHLLVYNHAPRGRSPLNVAVSADGKSWKAALVLEEEPGAEFSYPAVIQTPDGLVHVTWTWKRRKIRHAVIDPGKLVLRDIVDGRWPE